ncbi:tyrosine-type recombinase/integrase [Acutalibacter muris]
MILRLLFGCGMRIGEVLSLQMKDVDLENGIITIRNAKNEKDRLVPLHFNLAPVFIRYCIAIGVNNKSEALVFPGRDENDRIISTYLISY